MLVLPTPPLPLVIAITRVARPGARSAQTSPGQGSIGPSFGSEAFFIRLSMVA